MRVKESSLGLASRVHSAKQVARVDSTAARWSGLLALLFAGCWPIVIIVRAHVQTGWHAPGRLAWSVAILGAVAFIVRGLFLGRPVTARHAAVASIVLMVGIAVRLLAFDVLGGLLIAGSGLALMWPMSARRQPGDLARIWKLVNATDGDPLAPFTMQAGKCYFFSPDCRAGLAYRTRIGFAVVSGDPVGDETQFPQLVADFVAHCRVHGWRIAVLACSERRLPLWRDPSIVGRSLRPIPIGRDVVIDVATFTMEGRRFRNLRQAVRRTHNCGITTDIVAESDLDDRQVSELSDVLRASPSGAHSDRGFCMGLDDVLQGCFPGIRLVVARDDSGCVQGFHRYATAGGGREVSLDVPWRRRGAPNGIDERLSVDMIESAKSAGAQRVSLSFAAFSDLFDERDRSWAHAAFYWLIHRLDPLIALESLCRYLRKYHATGERRYALVCLSQLVPLMYVMMSLEFMPRRRGR